MWPAPGRKGRIEPGRGFSPAARPDQREAAWFAEVAREAVEHAMRGEGFGEVVQHQFHVSNRARFSSDCVQSEIGSVSRR